MGGRPGPGAQISGHHCIAACTAFGYLGRTRPLLNWILPSEGKGQKFEMFSGRATLCQKAPSDLPIPDAQPGGAGARNYRPNDDARHSTVAVSSQNP